MLEGLERGGNRIGRNICINYSGCVRLATKIVNITLASGIWCSLQQHLIKEETFVSDFLKVEILHSISQERKLRV